MDSTDIQHEIDIESSSSEEEESNRAAGGRPAPHTDSEESGDNDDKTNKAASTDSEAAERERAEEETDEEEEGFEDGEFEDWDFEDEGAEKLRVRVTKPYCRHWKLETCSLPGHMRRYLHRDPAEMPLLTAHNAKLPRKNVLYFHHPDAGARDSIGIVVACYNEEQEELHRTLFSLSRQRSPRVAAKWSAPTNYKHRICLIFDGIERMSRSMKEYVCSMFPSRQLHDLLFIEADRILTKLKEGGPGIFYCFVHIWQF